MSKRKNKIKRTPIEKVAVLARKAGMSYGKYVATHDVSNIKEGGPAPKYVCKKCGAEIYCAHKARKICDKCQDES